MIRIKLTIKDRLVLPELYPRRGDMLEQLLVKEINEKIILSSIERGDINLRTEATGFRWNDGSDLEIEVVFSKAEINFLKDQINRLDKDKQITQDILDTCLKIKEIEVIDNE